MIDPSEISDILKQQLDGLKGKAQFEEVGTVLNVGDGVAHVYGLDNVEANELVVFDNGATGVAMNLEESNVGVVLLDKVNEVTENMSVRRTGEIASIPVGEGLLGRVINVLGEPVDGKGPIEGSLMRLPLDRKAPGVIFRQPVKQPLQTGFLSAAVSASLSSATVRLARPPSLSTRLSTSVRIMSRASLFIASMWLSDRRLHRLLRLSTR